MFEGLKTSKCLKVLADTKNKKNLVLPLLEIASFQSELFTVDFVLFHNDIKP